MKLKPIIKIALRALARNKARSLLTTLGIIIGVGSVIAMVSLGQGAQQQVQAQIASMGTNMLIIQSGSQRSGGLRGGAGTGVTLTPEDAQAIERECPAVASVSPGIRNWVIASGEFFGAADVRTAARVAVIGKTVADQVFPGTDPVGQMMRVRNLPFRVVGVLQPKGQSQWGQDQDDTVLIPYTTAMKKLLSITHVPSILVSATSSSDTSAAEGEIEQLLRQRQNVRAGQDEEFTIRNLSDIADLANQTTTVMTLLLGSIAGVSLIVGGIGIMNIMLVSVTERTREIGIRMAVGARAGHVKMQFLIEAIVLGLAGGLAGVVVGVGLSFLLSAVFHWPQFISVVSIVTSLGFSVAVGVFFGYCPARKAASLDPIEALRYE